MAKKIKSKRSNIKKNISRLIIFFIVSILIGTSIYFCNAQNVFGSSMPMPFGVGISVVLSGSMEPELYKDDLVVIVKKNTYNIHDIVVFQSGNSLIIHRIVSINGNEVITKGDANDATDDPITLDDIKGKEVFKISKIGSVICYIQRSIWIKIVLICFAVFLLILSYRNDKSDDKQSQVNDIKEEIQTLKNELDKLNSNHH